MQAKEIGSGNSSRVPPIEIGDKDEYRYISTVETSKALELYGYGPKKRFVDALYISPDNSKAVGVLRVTEEHCVDHFVGNPVFRGVDELEAIAQTLLLLKHFSGEIGEGYTPRLEKSTVFPKWPVIPPVDVNIVVAKLGDGSFGGYGRILCGETVVVEGIVAGSLLSKELGGRIISRRKRNQDNSPSLFSVKE